jgi:competence protein ComEC
VKRRGFDQSDHIRLNLRWLDRQDSQAPIVYRMFAETPLLGLSLAMIAGILYSAQLSPSSVFFGLGVFVPMALVLMAAAIFVRSLRLKLLLTFASAVILCVCLGAARFATIRYQPPAHLNRLLIEDQQLATLRGRIISGIRDSGQERSFSSIPWLSSQSSFYLSADAIQTRSGWQPVTGTIRVQVNEPVEHLGPGDDVQLYCRLSRFTPPANPGQFDLQQHMHHRGVFVAAAVPIREGIEVIDRNGSWFFRLRSWLYRYSTDALLDETATDPDVRSLVSALLLGQRGSLDPTLVAAFQKTNLAHFISLSGMHVGILAGSLWILLRTAQISKHPRAVLCIILILTYALIVPPRAPTMRAVFLSCFFFASALLHRRINPLNTLALSAMVLLLARPYELFTAGWQLSFLSVFGILVFYTPVRHQLLDKIFYPIVLRLKQRFVRLQHVFFWVLELLAVGISTWIVIAPVLLYYFGQVNPLSPLWTVLLFPAVLLILYAGFLKLALASLLPTAAAVLGVLINLAAQLMEKMVLLLAKVDFLQIASHRPGAMLIAGLYVLLAAVYFVPFRYRRRRKALLWLLVGCFMFPWLSRMAGLRRAETLEMTCLSVGHGQAIVLSAPGGGNLLFDAGSITHQRIAGKIILPYLQHRRIFELDRIYVSHGDLDHLNALPEIAAMINTHEIVGNAVLLEQARLPSLEQQFSGQLAQLGLTLKAIPTHSRERIKIESLWPPEEPAENLSENDRSQVFLITYANRRVLLCGDIERTAQRAFLQRYPSLKVDVLVLPHHGSTTNLDTQFVERLDPQILIASCARRNQPNAYRPPESSPAKTFYTSTDGAVTVKIKADGTLGATGFLHTKQ